VPKIDLEIVKRMLAERPSDLLDLIEGDSEYCISEPINTPKDLDESYILRMACGHVWFVSEFGLKAQEAEKDGKYYSAYPDYFNQWLSLGCLALDGDSLSTYLKENPLD
jgi:hypothetical protein